MVGVIGYGNGIWLNPDYVPGGDERYTIDGDVHSWIWTEMHGAAEIGDATRFSDVVVRDITDDANTVLGGATTRDGGFVRIDELFTLLGITIEADSLGLTQISGDGIKLMGVMELDGQRSALIVTIPAPPTMMLFVFGAACVHRRR